MAELKTKATGASVKDFIDSIEDEERHRDCRAVMKLMKEVTKSEPKMWGPSIVGFGSYRYKYESGRELDWFVAGFSPRKKELTLYIMSGFPRHAQLLAKLGKHKTGKSCLYIKRLSDVDLGVLRELVEEATKHVTR